MAVLNLTKTQLAMICATGGSCATGVPVVLHFAQEKTIDPIQVSEDIENPRNSAELPVSSTDERERILTKTSESAEWINVKVDQEANFEKLWNKVSSSYIERQTPSRHDPDNFLTLKSELKSILISNRSLNHDEWMIEKEEYKNCSQISGGKTDYCMYLKLRNGLEEYRLKIDKYGSGQRQNTWDVFIVWKVGNIVKWYSKNSKNWENSRATSIDSFQGTDRQRENWWSTLRGKSIEI